jgi:hypothetical protein
MKKKLLISLLVVPFLILSSCVFSNWTDLIGDAGLDTSTTNITVNKWGAILVTGVSGGRNFVTYYDFMGAKQWTKYFGSSSATYPLRAFIGANANCYVTGYTTEILNGLAKIGSQDAFIAKYNSLGEFQWTRQFGMAGGTAYGNGIKEDANGNVYVTGVTKGGDGNFYGQYLQDPSYSGIFVVKYDAYGDRDRESVSLSSTAGGDTSGRMSADAGDNFYVFGSTNGTGLNGHAIPYNNFVMQYNPSGELQTLTPLLAPAPYYRASTIDASGNVYVTGITGTSLDGQPYIGPTYDIYVMKFDSSGVKQWTKQIEPEMTYNGLTPIVYIYEVSDIAVDGKNGNIYVAGDAVMARQEAPGFFVRQGFVIQFNPSGAMQWLKKADLTGVYAYAMINGIAIDQYNGLYVTGNTNLDATTSNNVGFVTTKFNY